MRIIPVISALTLLATIIAGSAEAQQRAPGLEARVDPGIALQYGIFGDDSPKSQQGTAISVGGQLVGRRSERFAWVFEGALQPAGLQNPHFDESVSSLYLQFGPEFGRRLHVRPTLGVALQSWSGTRSCQCVDMALAGGIAAGMARAVGSSSSVRITPEVLVRGSAAVGVFTSSVGIQVGVGWKQ